MKAIRILSIVLAVTPWRAAAAQNENSDVHLRNRCRQAAHWISAGPRHPHYEESLDMISKCDVSGGATLAARWQVIEGTDPRDIARLSYESRRLRDVSLLTVLAEVVADPSRPQSVRLRGLDVLVSYYDLGATLPADAGDSTTDPARCVAGGVSHVVTAQSAQPVSSADRPTIMSALQGVAANDSDPRMRRAAACAAAALGRL